ncbi:MAG: transketolase [Candidatus Aenigmatarchaeota archaeon]
MNIDKLGANTLRTLAIDAIGKANSGHPGMPLGCADMAWVLWTKVLQYCHYDREWPNRDRFILSGGHGSMLLYALHHLAGLGTSLLDIKNFRQWGSHTPGHPEYDIKRGVECTTGPLGQGFAMGVGMAIAQKMLAARLGEDLFNARIFGIVSDGDIQEGISSEAASLAGHLGLGNIVYMYDYNKISIEGPTDLTFSEDVATRFRAMGWHVVGTYGHNQGGIRCALEMGICEADRPTLIICQTHIGYGSPKQDDASVHGSPLNEDDIAATKEKLGWPFKEPFYVPEEVRQVFKARDPRLSEDYKEWVKRLGEVLQADEEKKKLWEALTQRKVPPQLFSELLASIPKLLEETPKVATRKASGHFLQLIADMVPQLVGGSADLAPSNNTLLKKYSSIAQGTFDGRNIRFGIREHAMGAILNGMALFGFIPYGGTFLVFSDYMRPAIRLAALMKLQVVYVFTHDSFYVGEDGPTHQPVEQLMSLRAIPNLAVIRPADPAETAAAWDTALRRKDGPTALALTRQPLPQLPGDPERTAGGVKRGAYIVAEAKGGAPEIIIIATGSEVHLALQVREKLEASGTPARVVSMPCVEIFREQEKAYKEEILPPECRRRVVIEAGVTHGWKEFAGDDGIIIGIDRFGASAPAKVLAEKFGFTPKDVLQRIEDEWGMKAPQK